MCIRDRYKLAKNEEEELVLPEMARSLSHPNAKEAKIIKIKDAKPSLQFALGLVSLLEQLKPSTLGPMYGRMWEIVLKILTKISMKKVIEAKLFERLISSFFLSTPQIQQTIYRQLLEISSKIIQFPNITTLIVNLIRTTIENAVDTSCLLYTSDAADE
eukprot:TRINITY_DN23852_c0_g1_i1.p1 TRINITY_DN23852_c0_g1~~TRINITY_DN23852_c0_g1_i1.p1  ORF type:complete len:159 (-),score=31.23 TRINITY_DN23852_c0_g1_i1:44-520(-)